MRTLVEVLASVAAGLPLQHYGFYRSEAQHGARKDEHVFILALSL